MVLGVLRYDANPPSQWPLALSNQLPVQYRFWKMPINAIACSHCHPIVIETTVFVFRRWQLNVGR